jgi:hypothetical protein
MNYQNEIYKINENLYIVKWFNFLKIEYNITLSESANFITDCSKKICKYINYEDLDKYNFNDLIYDEEKDKYKIYEEKKNNFPYQLLNIDYTHEMLYKNENNEWFLLKVNSYDTNLSVRCQQGEYKEYKIELSNDDSCDLVLKRNSLESFKYEKIYDEHYHTIRLKSKIKQLELYKNFDDPILNILFTNKFPLYFYPSYDHVVKNEIVDISIKVRMIELEGNENKVIIKYNGNEYFYAYIHFNPCCGSGTDSFIKLKNKQDMEYFDYGLFETDEHMQNILNI